MSSLASPSTDNQLVISLIGIDDHKSELQPATKAARKLKFDSNIFDTARQWGKAVRETNHDSILVADNRIETLDNLSSIGHRDIETDQGNNAGIKLLTDYCDRENINVGLKILLTNYPISKKIASYIRRRNDKGDNIIAIHKYDKVETESLATIFSNHYNERLKLFIKEKFEFVSALMDDWKLSDDEKNKFFGVSHQSDMAFAAISQGTTSRDAETRCDLIYRLKTNLNLILGHDDVALQTKWLRTKLEPLGNISPIDFLSDGYQYKLAELVYRVEGP